MIVGGLRMMIRERLLLIGLADSFDIIITTLREVAVLGRKWSLGSLGEAECTSQIGHSR